MCANYKGPHVVNYNRCSAYKKQAFHQHVVDNRKSYTSILKQNSALPPQLKGDTFAFSADQLIKFEATVPIQINQPQVCYSNAPKDTVDKKSSLCRRVSEKQLSLFSSPRFPKREKSGLLRRRRSDLLNPKFGSQKSALL